MLLQLLICMLPLECTRVFLVSALIATLYVGFLAYLVFLAWHPLLQHSRNRHSHLSMDNMRDIPHDIPLMPNSVQSADL